MLHGDVSPRQERLLRRGHGRLHLRTTAAVVAVARKIVTATGGSETENTEGTAVSSRLDKLHILDGLPLHFSRVLSLMWEGGLAIVLLFFVQKHGGWNAVVAASVRRAGSVVRTRAHTLRFNHCRRGKVVRRRIDGFLFYARVANYCCEKAYWPSKCAQSTHAERSFRAAAPSDMHDLHRG